MANLRIRWKRSYIGCTQKERRTIRSLGLRRLGQRVIKPDTLVFRGMVRKVRHLLQVEEGLD